MDNATTQETVEATNLPHVITFGTTIVGILLAGWLALFQQRKNAKEALKADIYEKIADKIDIAASSLVEANTAHTTTSIQLSLFWENNHLPHNPYTTITHTAANLIELHSKTAKDINNVTILLERYAITGKNFEIFGQMLGVQSAKHNDLLSDYQRAASNLIPSGMTGENTLTELNRLARIHRPSQDDIDHLKTTAGEYSSLMIETMSFLSDISISAQKHFLGTLFPNNILEYRVPLDPDVIVLKDDL